MWVIAMAHRSPGAARSLGLRLCLQSLQGGHRGYGWCVWMCLVVQFHCHHDSHDRTGSSSFLPSSCRGCWLVAGPMVSEISIPIWDLGILHCQLKLPGADLKLELVMKLIVQPTLLDPTHAHAHAHAHAHTYIHTYIPTYLPTYMHTYIDRYMHIHTHSFIHSFVRSFVRSFIHSFIHSFMHPSIHPSIHTYIVYIHVASRRQPPAPHRWAHTAGALRPKTSESTDCRKKKGEEFDGHV